MQIIKNTLNINFMAMRKVCIAGSLILVIASLVSLGVRGLNFGIDFTGGYLIEVGYDQAADLNQIRQLLADNGAADAIVQNFGTRKDILVRLPPHGEMNSTEEAAKVSDHILSILKQGDVSASMRRIEFVGPQVGGELKNDGGIAMLIALFFIMVYVALRFERRFSFGAVIALIHDVIIVLGWFSFLQVDFDLTVLAAILAVIGYSLNDTIVVYDRIRENFSKMRKADPVTVTNASINQTLSRTLMTSLTTLLVLISLFALGGEIIHGFALALILGIVVGTYSSIFVASPIVLALGLTREDLMQVKKEGSELERMP